MSININLFSENFIKVDFYFNDLIYEKIIQYEKFGFLSFVSEIGGLMGLLMGASVITLIEFLEYIVLKVINKL